MSRLLSRFPRQIGVGGIVISDFEKELVKQVLDSNQLTYGNVSRKFETEFAERHDCEFGLFMNSGTSALHIALAALKDIHGWKDGDEVIVPAVTFVATSNIVIHNNMVPVFVDVEKDTYNIDPAKIEEKITKKTRAIIPVHLLGLPANMGPIKSLADKYNLKIIEDSCECMFAKYGDKTVGSLGDIGCFSTYVAHVLVTGVGGLATTNNPDYAVKMRSMMNHGRDNIYISRLDGLGRDQTKHKEIIEKRFRFENLGHSFRCTELEAALGLGQLAKSQDIIEKRKRIAMKLTRGLKQFEEHIQLPSCPDDRTHCYMLYGIVLKRDTKKNLVHFLEDLNIETREMLPLINQPIYKKLFGNIEDQYPVSKWINNSGFYIGCHPYMEDEEVDFIVEAFRQYFTR